MNETFKQYIVEPHPWWKVAQYSGMDGYDTIEQAERRGWHVIPADRKSTRLNSSHTLD
jgi:hypothetical protein